MSLKAQKDKESKKYFHTFYCRFNFNHDIIHVLMNTAMNPQRVMCEFQVAFSPAMMWTETDDVEAQVIGIAI